MPAPYRVSDLIAQVRDQTDEANVTTVSDEDIVQTLNRGLIEAAEILCKHYPDPLIDNQAITLVGGTQEYDMPEDIYSDRILQLEIYDTRNYIPVSRIPYHESQRWETTSRASVPSAYTVFGRTIRLFPIPNGTYNARIWYVKKPETLTKDQGMITAISSTSLTLDTAGDYDSSTNIHGLEMYDASGAVGRLTCWINVVDAQTGEVKGSYEIAKSTDSPAGINAEVVSIDAAPERTSVLNKTIGTSLASTIAVDDFVSNIRGTGIVYYPEPMTNFLIQFAVSEIRRRLENSPDTEDRVLQKFEATVKSNWAGREHQLSVKRKASQWETRWSRRHWTL